MLRFILIIAIITLGFASPLHAAEINQAGADHLKTLFSQIIEKNKTSMSARGDTLETVGDLTVEQGKDYYGVTLPSIIVKQADGSQTKLGLIAANVIPTENKDEWKMSIAIPTPIIYADKDGKETSRLDIGNQKMNGVWNEKLNNFSKLVGQYGKLKMSSSNNKPPLNIEQFDLLVDLNDSGNNLWSGDTRFMFKSISMGAPETPGNLQIGETGFNIAIEEFSPEKQKQTLEKIGAAQKAGDKTQNKNLFMDLIKSAGKSISVQASIKNVAGVTSQKDQGSQKIKLDNADISLSMNGMDKTLLNKNININYTGLEYPDNKFAARDAVPANLKTKINFSNLPIEEILNIVSNMLPHLNSDNKQAQQLATLQATMTLPQVLAKAGTVLTLTDTAYGNETYQTTMQGQLKANSKSLLGTTGNLLIKTTGLDTLISKLEKNSQTATEKEKPQLQKMIEQLKYFAVISNKENDTHTANIVLDETAKITVNGKQVDPMKQMVSQKKGQ